MRRKRKKKNIKLLKNKKRAARRSKRIKNRLLNKNGKTKTNNKVKLNKSSYTNYKFVQKGGKKVKGVEIVFPIIRKKENGHFEFLATGFFINSWGGFATAKHVFFDKDRNGEKEIDLSTLYAVHFHSDNSYTLRKIESKNLSPKGDSAVGMLESLYDSKGKLVQNKVLPMSNDIPKIEDEIKTFAYPKSKMFPENDDVDIGEFSADWFTGKVVEHFPNGRDSTFLPSECFQTNVNIYGGASGGPIINKKGVVIGINSTGYEQDENSTDDPISFITPIREAFKIKVQIGKNEYATIEEVAKIDSVKIE